MANVTRVGQETLFQSTSQDSTHAITVPACDCIVVCITGAQGGSGALVDAINFDNSGTDLTQIASEVYGGGFNVTQVDTYRIVASSGSWPGAGSKTLYVNAPASRVEGYNVSVLYYENVDQTTPTGDTDTHVGDDDGASFTSALTGVGAEDMGIVVAYRYSGNPVVNGNSQTQIHLSNSNNAGIGVAEKLGEDAMVATSASDLVAVAFVLKAAASAGASASIAGQTPLLAGSASANLALSSTVAGATPLLVGAISSGVGISSTIAGTTPLLAGSFGSSVGISSTIAGTTPLLTGAFSSSVSIGATIAGATPLLVGSLSADSSIASTISGTLPPLTGAFAVPVGSTSSANIDASISPLTGAVSVEVGVSSTLASTISPLVGAFSATVVEETGAAISATIPLLSGAFAADIALSLSINASTSPLVGAFSVTDGTDIHVCLTATYAAPSFNLSAAYSAPETVLTAVYTTPCNT